MQTWVKNREIDECKNMTENIWHKLPKVAVVRESHMLFLSLTGEFERKV
jgi:hypothetical protein